MDNYKFKGKEVFDRKRGKLVTLDKCWQARDAEVMIFSCTIKVLSSWILNQHSYAKKKSLSQQ